MGRKKTEPRRLGEEQRQQVGWNMADVAPPGPSTQQTNPPGDLIILEDNDPSLAVEWESAEKELVQPEKPGHVSNGVSAPSSNSACVDLPVGNGHKASSHIVPDKARSYFQQLDMKTLMVDLTNHYLRVPLYSQGHSRCREVQEDWHWVVGQFSVKLRDHAALPLTSPIVQCLSLLDQCWLYIAFENESEPIILFEVPDGEKAGVEAASYVSKSSTTTTTARRSSGGNFRKKRGTEDCLRLYWTVEMEFQDSWKFFQKLSRSGQKKFQLVYGEIDGAGGQLQVTVYGRKDSVQRLDFPSQAFTLRDVNNFLCEAMGLFYNLGPQYGKADGTLHQDFHELYEGVRAVQQTLPISVTVNVQHPSLKPVLRPYQRDAVHWMLQRERFCQHDIKEQEEDDDSLHPLYTEVTTHCGKTVFYNRQAGSLILDRPRKVVSPPGGILADEMGLGKTVEVLCCMLLHPRPHLPPPTRLPTLTEMEFESESEESMMECPAVSASSSASDLSASLSSSFSIEGPLRSDSAERHTLKRVDSACSSVSSVPSEAVTYVVTGDHSYLADASTENGDNRNGGRSEALNADDRNGGHSEALLTTSSSADQHTTPVTAEEETEGHFKSPLKLKLKRMSPTSYESVDEEEQSTDRDSDSQSQPKTKKRRASSSSSSSLSKNGKLKSQGRKKGKTRKGKKEGKELIEDGSGETAANGVEEPTAGNQKPESSSIGSSSETDFPGHKSFSGVADSNSETGIPGKKTKRRDSKYSYYVEEKEEDARPPRGILDQLVLPPKQQLFECVCGKGEHESVFRRIRHGGNHTVKCTECGTSQHAKCVNYDLDDPFRGPYKCPHCHYSGTQLPSGATLIISPYSIAHQWLQEIHKHMQAESIRVFEYTGVRNLGYIQPQTLARQDIVITTYETLRNELNYVDLKPTNSTQGRTLRNPKKFMAQPTPLTTVEWWRICLDEAQMVESVTTKTAEMALRLRCVNRWCVTGTPLNQSIKDLYGLLAFIGYDPYCMEEWWTRLLYQPYLQGVKEPMFQALATVLWRSSMKHVKAQLHLPDRSEVVKHLTFSPVENVFYKRIYALCSSSIMISSSDLTEKQKSTKLRKLDHQTVNKYLNPLRKLRQACCHPQAVAGSNLSMKSSVMTMEELLDNLIKKTTTECEESHRGMIAAMNGQAGICLIEDPPRVCHAVDLYREVLRSVEELQRTKGLKTDTLPQIHAVHNLAQVLATRPPGVGHTMRDDQLQLQCEDLKKKYLEKTGSVVAAGKDQLTPIHQAVNEATRQLGGGIHWYQQVMNHAVVSGKSESLLTKVDTWLFDRKMEFRERYIGVSGLQYRVVTELTSLLTMREQGLRAMRELETRASSLKTQVILCCLRPVDGKLLRNCAFCKLDKHLLEWESQLFWIIISQRTQAGVDNELYRQGSWQDSVLETTLKALLSYARTHHLDGQMLKEAASTISLFELWKKEFRLVRAQWTKLKEAISAEDELEMAVTRMRLRLPDEQGDRESMNVVDRLELPYLLRKFSSDQKMYASELKQRCGQLDYLRNLAKGSSDKFEDGINPEECPICKNALGQSWSVLRCGHCCCLNCVQHLIERCPASRTNNSIRIKCMICRETISTAEISYISTSRNADDDDANVKGSHSTKVKAIVQCLHEIHKKEPEAKTLVFATWVEVLKVIGKALEDNDISYTQLYDHGSNYEKNVNKFRTDAGLRVLLLPYSTGSKGLNLFEANHVLLVEPTYSPSEEAQAIGRVYRMGQTRQTTIHRFLVGYTIEERIHRLRVSTLRSTANVNEMDNDTITLRQLIALFDPQQGEDTEDEEEDVEEEEQQQQEEEEREEAMQEGGGGEAMLGPRHAPSGLDHLPWSSSRPDGVPGPSFRHDVTMPSSRPDDVTVPSSRPDDVTMPSSRRDGVPGPSSRPDDVTMPSSRPDDVIGPSSRPDDVTGPSSRPDDVTMPSSRPDDVIGPSSRLDDVTISHT